MKYSDDFYDQKHNVKMASFMGICCALVSAMAAIYNVEAAYIFWAILIGNLLALKVDGIHHILTVIIFIVMCLLIGFPEFNYVVLLICILAALSDEIGHEQIPEHTQNRFINLFFEYRFVMKIVILILAVVGEFSIWIFVCFILFEIFYEIAGILFEKLS